MLRISRCMGEGKTGFWWGVQCWFQVRVLYKHSSGYRSTSEVVFSLSDLPRGVRIAKLLEDDSKWVSISLINCRYLYSPFLATGRVNLESHCCCDESIIFFVVDVIHLERSPILNVSVAAQFNSIDLMAECECGVLKWDACSEFAV